MTDNGKTESMGYRTGRLHRLSLLVMDRWLEELGLRYGVVPFLCSVLKRKGLPQDELAARASVSPARAARALSWLEGAGFVTRLENPENRRQKLVHPTDKALGVEDAFFALLGRHNDLLLAGFDEGERAQALEYLDRMTANLQAEADGGDR